MIMKYSIELDLSLGQSLCHGLESRPEPRSRLRSVILFFLLSSHLALPFSEKKKKTSVAKGVVDS